MNTVGTVIIDVNADTAKLVSGMDRAEKSVKKSVENIKKSLVTMAGAYLGFQGASKAYDAVITSGLAYNMQLEESKAGLVALSVAVQNETIPIMERYANANKEAIVTLEELQKINAATPHTLDQTNQIYKAMYVSMKNVGASTEDLISLTKQISIAAGAGGIEFNSLLAGVDGLATGTVLANSDLGRFLSSLGLTNEELKKSTDIVGLLERKLSSFKAPDTYMVALSNMINAWDQLAGEISKPLFEERTESIKYFSEVLNQNKDDIVSFAKSAGNVGVQIAEVGASIIVASTALKAYSAIAGMAATSNVLLGGSYGALNRAILLTTISTKALGAAQKAIPFVALTTATYGIIELFPKLTSETSLAEQAMNKYAESIRGASDATLDFEISKITKEIAKVRKAANDEARNRGAYAPVSGYGETLAYELTALSQQLDILEKQKKAIKEKKDLENSTTSSTTKNDSSALTAAQLKAQEKLEAENQKVKDSFIEITGSDYEKWLVNSNNKMIALSKNGVLTAKELQQAWDSLSLENTIEVPTASLNVWSDYYRGIGDLQTAWLASKERVDAHENAVLLGLKDADYDAYIKRYKTEFIDKVEDSTKNIEYVFTNAFKGMEDSLVDFVKTGKLDFSSLVDSILEDMLRLQIQQSISQPLMSAIGTGGSNVFSSIGSYFFEDGGIMTSSGKMPLKTYSTGGIADSAQVAIYGEGSMNEAFVPLPDGKTIPVTMNGGGGSNVIVNIENNTDTAVTQDNVTTSFDGGTMIVNVVLDAITRNKGGMRDSIRGVR